MWQRVWRSALALLVTLGGGLVVAILALVVRNNGTLRGVDSGAADWGHDHATTPLDAPPPARHRPGRLDGRSP